jgi:predicted TIM-barrel fold metal-dependent hydrolase
LLSEAPAENSCTARCKCTIEAIGIERLMFAVDWAFQSNTEGRDFIDSALRSDAAKARIFEGNARRLLRL